MKIVIIILTLIFSVCLVYAENASTEAEEVAIEDMEEVEHTGHVSHGFLGLPKYRWLSISGPVIWLLMVSAIITRWIKIKGQAPVLLRLHKTFAYSAFGVATLHGILGLFF
ncbi:hypothetical protein [Desulfonema magnum]|uniref:Ferric oxidoreductase domain-containing protein n=1 Tax=Desulfonema magnum TaxID=45655 RepID=A0A975BF98_9BACT|nr:hypothetical protein [Desulfonema magnum]QTA84230.1 Uncharacterized protein dnm_002240 [Desulfonema magnum]